MKKKKQNMCFFCGSPGASREHIVAKWIGRSLTPSPIPGTTIKFRHRSANPEAGIELVEKSASGPAFYTRSFCRKCNGSWMSQLEDAVKPILGPMLRGQLQLIDAEAGRILSLWATKTILAFQTNEAELTTFARPDDFKQLFETRRALADSQIWLGAVRQGDPLQYRAHSVRRTDESPDGIDGFGATLVVGHVAFYFLLGFSDSIKLRLNYSISAGLREIHPRINGDFAWPPKGLLNPHEEHGLAEQVMTHSRLSDPA